MFKKVIIILAVIGIMSPCFVLSAPSEDDPFGIVGASKGTRLIKSTQSVPELIGSIIGIALSFVGVVFFLLILYAGFRWMTAFGNEEKVTESKSVMEQAAIGLVIVLAAYAISNFVFGTLLQVSNPSNTSGPVANPLGCCVNPTTGNQIENLESECVPNATNPRKWTVGRCVVGCCYVTVAGSCTPEEMAEVECQQWGNRGSWSSETCEASCP